MRSMGRKQAEKSLFKGQKYDYEGYPGWYNDELATNQPIPTLKFGANLTNAAFFYQKEDSKLSFANTVLKTQLTAVLKEIQELRELISEAEQNENSSADEKKKRIRRCASQIERKYVCPIQNCEKSYGTEGSMAQHMRIKHPGVVYVMADLNPEPELKHEYLEQKREENSVRRENRKKKGANKKDD